MEHFEQLHSGIRILQPERCFAMSTDSVLVANFLTLRARMKIADLGSGSGNIAFLLAGRRPDCHITGIELQADACAAALKSVALNQLEQRITMLQADLRQIRSILPPGQFDAAVSNPPYFPVGTGRLSERHAEARSEKNCNLEQLCAAAAWLVRTGGTFALVHRPERLCDLMVCLRQSGFEPKRMQFVRHDANAPVSLLLLESRRGGGPGLKLEPDLVLFTPQGTPTPAYQAIYHCE